MTSTNMQTLQAQVNQLMNRVDALMAVRTTLIGSDCPSSPTTVTAASFTNLTAQYAIPANDAAVNTTYRLAAWGDMSVPSSGAAALTWCIKAYGLNGNSTPNMAMTAMGGGSLAGFPSSFMEWWLWAVVQLNTVGASGAFVSQLFGGIGQFHGPAPPSGNPQGNNNSWALTGGATGSVDTTGSTTFGLQAMFGSSVSGQNIRYFGSTLERMGP